MVRNGDEECLQEARSNVYCPVMPIRSDGNIAPISLMLVQRPSIAFRLQ